MPGLANLHAELAGFLEQIEAVRQRAHGLTHGLTNPQWNWHPPDGGWSIAECVEHLNVINRLYLSSIGEAIQKGRAAGRTSAGPYRHPWLGNLLLRTIEPPVKRKFRAPRKFQPAAKPQFDGPHLLADFDALHSQMKKLVTEANGLDLGRVRLSSPALSLLRISLGQAFAILCAHDRRHLWQSERLRENPVFPR